ncbi:UPF0389 protein CG9231 [Trichogramma pretiosum]|uniref:UPF0389 protein CG9231 n=1 Tax=Trichogramma pretiosum TaxID=7493 RepID=UPI0006C95FC1|nr:UPF0389 protein CG9231 [Trichogramma pretiosum]
MSSSQVISRTFVAVSRRLFQSSARCLEAKAPETAAKATEQAATHRQNPSVVGHRMYALSDFDKWVLVWMKKFPKGKVPDKVPEHVIYQTRSRARIKAANYLTGICIIGCFFAVYTGRKAAKSGDSIQKRREEWHKQLKEEHEAEMAAKKAKQ